MAYFTSDPDRKQAGGWRAEGAGEGDGLHIREAMRIAGLAKHPLALVVRCYADFWITTIEPWEDDG